MRCANKGLEAVAVCLCYHKEEKDKCVKLNPHFSFAQVHFFSTLGTLCFTFSLQSGDNWLSVFFKVHHLERRFFFFCGRAERPTVPSLLASVEEICENG